MANENKEIGDIVKKCKILLLDIEGTTTSISFVKDKLFPYAEENVKKFLDSQWENADVKDAVTALRKLAIEDQEGSVEGVVVIPGEDASKEDQIEGLVKNVKWQMSADRKVGPLKQLQGLIWKQGYDNGDIKGHVYDDVSAALEGWRAMDDQKVYIYSSGSVQAQKMLFGQSLAGDLLKYIDGHFDTAVGAKQEAASYTNIVEKIGCKPDEILFLTDIVKEAEAARAAGLHAALVSREGNAPLAEEATAAFPVIHSLAELTVSNKRKPEPQEAEVPAAKVLKTDSDNVKSTSEKPSQAVTTESAEKMEVEETATAPEETKPMPIKEQVIVEELDSNEGSSVVSVIDIEPVAVEEPKEEKEEKTEGKETDSKKETTEEAKKDDVPAPEQTPPAVIMEVEEVPDDKPLPDVAEVIEDISPVVEEPDNVEEMEELKNVGEVLEKECDEILSKVNNVTNLDNITVKPLLNPIAEETMETENVDSNDIVDRILDTETEQNTDIDLNTITEITEDTKTVMEENNEKKASKMETTEKNEVSAHEETEKIETENKVEKITEAQETKGDNAQKPEAESKELTVEDSSSKVEASSEVKQDQTVEQKVKDKTDEAVVTETIEEKPAQSEEAPVAKEEKPIESTLKEGNVEKEETQLNGNTANGDSANDASNGDAKEAGMNGDASKEEELSARLSVDGAEENGNGKVNGANGEPTEEKGQGDCKAETEVADIKVKTVTTDEPRTDPIEQPTQA